MKPTFIIEHLEPKLWPWCMIEYRQISKIIGKSNLWFTNIKNKKDKSRLIRYGKVIENSVRDIGLKLDKACILDPSASKTIIPKEAKQFNYFIFGGILGDYPARKRTKKELTINLKDIEKRNIGKKQLSTDNAVYVVKEIIKGRNLKSIKMKNKIEIKINKIESIILPYRYPLINGKPNISDELIKYLKNKKEF